MTATPSVGTRLRAIAARVCSTQAMERVIDPLIADLQVEHGDALEQGRRWRARWIRVSAAIAFVKVLAYCAGARMMTAASTPGTSGVGATAAAVAEGRVIGRTIACVGVATVILMGLLMLPVLLRLPAMGAWRTFVVTSLTIPQAIPLAVPVGFSLGIVVALGGRALSRRSIRLVLILALVGSVVSFATIAWGFAAANRAFQQAIYGARMTGVNELTLFEFRERLWASADAPAVRDPLMRGDRGRLVRSYYVRWALSCATIVLGVLGLAVLHRRRIVGIAVGLVANIGYGYYYAILHRLPTPEMPLPDAAMAWLPNVVILTVAAGLFFIRSRRVA